MSRRRFLRNASAAASIPMLAGVADILSTQGAGAQTYKRNNDHPFFASHPKYHFVMVNHVTTNSFFTATIYGCQDACALTGYQLHLDRLDELGRLADGLGHATPRSPRRRTASACR